MLGLKGNLSEKFYRYRGTDLAKLNEETFMDEDDLDIEDKHNAARYTLVVPPGNEGIRVDTWIAANLPEYSRSFIQKLIEEGQIKVDGRNIRSSYRVGVNDILEINIPPPVDMDAKPEDIPLEILYEDQDLLVVNKPKGMVVHPAHGNYQGTLVNALLAHCKDLSGIGGVNRPGIVHRLDKDTTGLLMVAKNDLSHQILAQQIKDRLVTRLYIALVHGQMRNLTGTIDAPIGRHLTNRKKMAVVARNGKAAITHYRILEVLGAYTLIEARLDTGRTHQIRVHMSYIGHPVVGDTVYGPKRPHLGLKSQALHATYLAFHHPRTDEYLKFSTPLPEEFAIILEKLRKKEHISP